MKRPTKPAALTYVDYLEQKIKQLNQQLQSKDELPSEKVRKLYFKLGKAYSDLELMKRVQPYD